MLRGIYTSAAGMMTESKLQRNLADDLSNMNTPGYQAKRAVRSPFGQMLLHRAGNAREGLIPLTTQLPRLGTISAGSRIAEVTAEPADGRLQETDRNGDVALRGPGYFVVDTGERVVLTRDGRFSVDEDGYLVTAEGYRVQGTDGPLPVEDSNFSVTADGEVRAGDQTVGVLLVASPPADALRRVRPGYFALRDDVEGNLAEWAAEDVSFMQGHVELSNVDPVEKMTELLAVNRSYGANFSVLNVQNESIEEVLGMLNNL